MRRRQSRRTKNAQLLCRETKSIPKQDTENRAYTFLPKCILRPILRILNFVSQNYSNICIPKSQSGKKSLYVELKIFTNLICFQNTFSIIGSFLFRIEICRIKKSKRKIQFFRKRQMQQFSSLKQLPFSEDKRRKSSPPERSDKNWIFNFDFPAYFTAEKRGCGGTQYPHRVLLSQRKAGVWGYAISPQNTKTVGGAGGTTAGFPCV